jgi:hypothetical protein
MILSGNFHFKVWQTDICPIVLLPVTTYTGNKLIADGVVTGDKITAGVMKSMKIRGYRR